MTQPASCDAPVLAVDIGGHKYGTALCLPDGRVLDSILTRTELRAGAQEIAAGVLAQARELRRRRPEAFARARLCGVGFGGPVHENRPWRSMHVPGWQEIDLCAMLNAEFGLAARMGNDGDVSALGEHRFGAGRGLHSIVFLTVSTGIGGGVILNDALWRGAHGFAGELGHVKVRGDGPQCPCGSVGCLESHASGTALGLKARAAAAERPAAFADLLRRAGGTAAGIDARVVAESAAAGDSAALKLWDGYVEDLARGVGAIINAFDPDAVVIGGGVSRAGETLLSPLRAKVRHHVMPMTADLFSIRRAELDDNTVFLGAMVWALAGPGGA